MLQSMAMWPFSSKKEEKSVDDGLEQRVKDIENKILELYLDMDVMKTKVLKKLQSKRVTTDMEEIQKKTGMISMSEYREMQNNGTI